MIRTGSLLRDTLVGDAGNDVFYGLDGSDVVFGNGGNDWFDGGLGADRLHAGAGADTALGGDGDDTVFAGSGDDLVQGGDGADLIYGGAGADSLYGDEPGTVAAAAVSHDDLIESGAGNDLADGGLGNDEIQGEGGNDTIIGGRDNGRLVWTGGGDAGGKDEDDGDGEDGDGKDGDGEDGDGKDGDGEDHGDCADALRFTIADTHDGSRPGNPVVAVEVTEMDGGTLLFHVTVQATGRNVADLRGLFLQIDDEDLAASLSATGTWVTGFTGAEDKVDNLGGGVNTQGVKTGPFDFGLSFGTSGIGKDDVREASFILASSKGEIGLDLLEKMDVAARLTSFGEEGGDRGGSLKLVGNAGKVIEGDCDDEAGPTAAATTAAPATTTAAAAADPATLAEVAIGDNLYGNDGRDTFVFARGDGVDLIWDFEAGRDVVEVKGYGIADVDAFTLVTEVTNNGRGGAHPLDAGSHEKLAIILDAGGDAIVFNDLGNRASTADAVRFEDGTMSVWEMLMRAAPATAAATAGVETGDVSARLAVTNTWQGGFQGEITVTALAAVTDWDLLLGTRWNVTDLWGAQRGATTPTTGGRLIELDDADWNGTLAAGETATIGFTAAVGGARTLSAQAILDGMWIG